MNALFEFKAYSPQHFLSLDRRTNLSDSPIQHFLTQVYQPLVANFTKLSFKSLKDFVKLYGGLLKLTNTMLGHFKDVAPKMKAPLSHRFPQYDELLRIFSEALNSQNLEFLIINALMLSEELIKGQSTGITNKFWLEQLKQGGHFEDSKQRIRTQKMIKHSLACLNSLLELSLFKTQIEAMPTEDRLQIGARGYYVQGLSCVSSISNLVKNPGQWEQYPIQTAGNYGIGSTVQYSLFNIVQYYVKPHLHLCPFMTQIQISAVKFLFNCAKIWETQALGQRVSLESTLRTSGISNQEVRLKYIQNLRYTCKQIGSPICLKYIAAFLDLLIVASSTQTHFVSELFKESDFVQVFQDHLVKKSVQASVRQAVPDSDRNPALRALALAVESKVVILIAEMAGSKICEGFLRKMSEQDDLVKLYENIIRAMIDEISKTPKIEFVGETSTYHYAQESITMENNKHSLNLYTTCQAFVTIKYFMKLLAEEYQRDLSSKAVKKTICALYSDGNLIHGLNPKLDGRKYLDEMLAINEVLQAGDCDRNRPYLEEYQRRIETGPKLTSDQEQMFRSVSNKLLTGPTCPVFLNNLDCSVLLSHLRKEVHPYSLFQCENSLEFQQYSRIGSKLAINTDELVATARTYFYEDETLLSEIRRIASEFNMAISYLYSFQQFVQGHFDFILAVGKARMRENMRNKSLVLSDRAFSTSLFNLVVSEDLQDVLQNRQATQGAQEHLAKILIELAIPISKKIATLGQNGLPRNRPMLQSQLASVDQDMHQAGQIELAFEIVQNELDIDFLCVILGAINSLSEIDDFPISVLKILDGELIATLMKGLPRVRQAHFIQPLRSNQLTSGSQALKLENEQRASQLFVNLVLQIFSLSLQIQQKSGGSMLQIGSQNMQQQQKAVTEYDFIQVMSYVLKIMQEGGASFISGLKIVEQGLALLSPENVRNFMRKQDFPPLKVILQRFLNNQSTIEEKVKIIEFLTSYARIEMGAEHLFQENILKSLSISSLMSLMNQVDFYVVETEAKRNPIHILWCHVLLFLRTINFILLPDSEDYRRQMGLQIGLLWERVIALLEFGRHLEDKKFDSKAISLALYEELELITGLVQQYFDFTDVLHETDYAHYAQIKDQLLFGVLHIFTSDRPPSQNSSTEQYLLGMTHERIPTGVLKNGPYTGLDFAIDIQRVRIFFNVMSSLLNAVMINANRSCPEDFINTWNNQVFSNERIGSKRGSRAGGSYSQTQTYGMAPVSDADSQKQIINFATCTATMIAALQNMTENFKLWLTTDQHLSELHEELTRLLRHDEWVNLEYLGLNRFFAGPVYREILVQYEEALQMGYLTVSVLLAKLREAFEFADSVNIQVPLNLTNKQLIDYGELVIDEYLKLEAEIKRTKVVKLSVDESYGKIIQKYITQLREGWRDVGFYESVGGSRSRTGGFR